MPSVGDRAAARPGSGAVGQCSTGLTRLHLLADGQWILIRPMIPSDREELATRYQELSQETRRLRFGNSAPDELSAQWLDRLIDLDLNDRVALGAVVIDELGAPGVGVARYARHEDDPTSAEVAVAVLDTYQHRGIGRLLFWDLADAARARGITTFTATVMWESRDLIDAIIAAGATVQPAEPGVASVRYELAEVSGGRGRWLRRARVGRSRATSAR